MTIRGRLVSLFPLVHLGLVLYGLAAAIGFRDPLGLVWSLGFLYLFPPLCFRIHHWLCPVEEGRHPLDQPDTYSPWWASLQFQAVYNAAPWIEGLLRLIPGVYSAWLRLWGSEIGRGVVWTPRVEISDRAFLEIGNEVVIGHRAAFYGHVVDRRRNGETRLYLKRIRIGDRAFIGAGSRLGPGAAIEENVRLPILTDVGIGKRIEEDR